MTLQPATTGHDSSLVPDDGGSAVEDRYPLSPMQAGMLFQHLYRPGSGVDIEQLAGSLHEALDTAALEQAWQRVAARHAALRTSFDWEK